MTKRENSPDAVMSSMDILVYSSVDKVTKIQSLKVGDRSLLVELNAELDSSTPLLTLFSSSRSSDVFIHH